MVDVDDKCNQQIAVIFPAQGAIFIFRGQEDRTFLEKLHSNLEDY